ncbi:MAG: DUF983 domain-containing protein [Chloroflexota bacterium]
MPDAGPGGADPAATRSGPLPWPNLPPPGWARARVLAARALTRRCPYCGGGRIFGHFFRLKKICPTCEVEFEREDGYFIGGYAINLVFSETLALVLAVWLLFGTSLRDAPLLTQEIIAVALAVLLPLFFFPYSRSVWMALDLTLHPPQPQPERYVRTSTMSR